MDDAEKARISAELHGLFAKLNLRLEALHRAAAVEPDEQLSLEERLEVVRRTLPALERDIQALEFAALGLFGKS